MAKITVKEAEEHQQNVRTILMDITKTIKDMDNKDYLVNKEILIISKATVNRDMVSNKDCLGTVEMATISKATIPIINSHKDIVTMEVVTDIKLKIMITATINKVAVKDYLVIMDNKGTEIKAINNKGTVIKDISNKDMVMDNLKDMEIISNIMGSNMDMVNSKGMVSKVIVNKDQITDIINNQVTDNITSS